MHIRSIVWSKCFWCDRVLAPGEATRDHVVPQYVAKFAGSGRLGGCNTVTACRHCNGQRARITGLYSELRRGRGTGRNWSRLRGEMNPILDRFEQLIRERLEGKPQELCLKEIEIVRTALSKAALRGGLDVLQLPEMPRCPPMPCRDCGKVAARGKVRCRPCQRIRNGEVGIVLTRPDPKYPNIPVAWAVGE
jgi:hypothetical protein